VFKDKDGNLRTSMIVRDITQRKQAEDALQERELQYRSVFESTTDGLIINSFDGRIIEANPAACRMNGYSRDEFLSLEPMSVIHPKYRHLFSEFLQTVHAGGQFEARAVNVRKDGTQFDVEVRGTQFIYKSEPHVLGIVRDITEQVRAYQLLEQRVEERTRELSTLLEISRTVTSTLELEPLLDLILDQLKVMVDYTSASVFTLQADALVVVAYRGPRLAEEALQFHIPLADPLLREMILDRPEPVFIPDVAADEPAAQSFRYIIRGRLTAPVQDVRAAMWIPLIVKQRVIGGLGVTHSEAGCFTERHANLALTIANQAAVAIENARLYEQAQALATLQERQRLARELHDSVTQSLYSLTLLAEAGRRLAKAGNWERVQTYLGRLGQMAQQSLKDMRLLVYELRPLVLAQEGLVGALQQRLDAVEGRAGVEARLLVEGTIQLPAAIEVGLYRIAQEALNNALKHAAATSVIVRIRAEADQVELQVTDNGRGFDPVALSDQGGLGLVNMRERATSLKGVLSLSSSPGQGTTVKVQIPTSSHP
jgi:PAS domain S-box-containing protein